jgi:hypothetical protein
MGFTDSPTCKRCLEKDESATHILCDCEAIAYLRFRHLGHYFVEPGDYQDAPISKLPHFIRSVGLLEGSNRGGCTIYLGKVAVPGPIKAYPLFIHSFNRLSYGMALLPLTPMQTNLVIAPNLSIQVVIPGNTG